MENGKILLIHRIKKNDDYWVFPGGGVEEDESEIMALKRECKEELGVEVAVGDYIMSEMVAFDGVNGEHLFYAASIAGGEVGTGEGPEYANDGLYEGSHQPEWIELEELEARDVRPEKAKDLVLKINNL